MGQGDPIGLFRPQGETDRDKPRAGGGQERDRYRAIGINALHPLPSHNRLGAVRIAARHQLGDEGTDRLWKSEAYAAETYGHEHDKSPDADRAMQVAVQAQPPRAALDEEGSTPPLPPGPPQDEAADPEHQHGETEPTHIDPARAAHQQVPVQPDDHIEEAREGVIVPRNKIKRDGIDQNVDDAGCLPGASERNKA